MTEKKNISKNKKTDVLPLKNTNKLWAEKIKTQRSKQPSINQFVEGIVSGDISFLSRAITLIESTNSEHQKKANEILERCLPYANNSIRIGITGVPGVGKSTFIEALGNHITALEKKVAVLAIDPSSSVNKGSILGDKTRMEQLVANPNAFIRPSPSGCSLGGVAQKTRESIILCEAAGFDTIIVETVGVGQSETAVHEMVDFFLLLKLAGAGDELQGIKRGIIEMADAIVINKADGDNEKNAKIAKTAFNRALHLYPPKETGWQPKVLTASALKNKGINPIYKMIEQYVSDTKHTGLFQKKRAKQNKYWLIETINQELKTSFFSNSKVQKQLQEEIKKVENGTSTPFNSAKKILPLL
ncbi:methylmalonyl Co-A mutase-associated GTPase MeaB [Tenacibaculum sp. UWU-22]|uniref:methylmalonyl Co-A mutase-associated GTPase MeaB n=1 Tax=Tenacibaculum sp. UWU-22 TaxID=3234187 RepID=UPI0034DB5A7A